MGDWVGEIAAAGVAPAERVTEMADHVEITILKNIGNVFLPWFLSSFFGENVNIFVSLSPHTY